MNDLKTVSKSDELIELENNRRSAAKKQELVDRQQRIKKSIEAQKKPLSVQNIADQTQATGDKFRLFPEEHSFFDDYINPGVMIGNMASGLGRVPLNIQQEDYEQATAAVVTPLALGRMIGSGNMNPLSKNFYTKEIATKDFANQLLNPLAGVGDLVQYGFSKTKNSTKLIGNPKNVLDKGLDVHDVRLKYHNNQLLDFDEQALLNIEGKGNVKNYRKIDTEDKLGSTQVEDAKPQNFNKDDLKKTLFGREQDKVEIPSNYSTQTVNDNINLYNQEQGININKKNWDPDDFVIHNVKPYQRTSKTREADKWISDWYSSPTTKQKFIDYGGTETEWTQVQNSLENPILSNYNWGNNRPGGLYMPIIDKASVPLNAPTDIAVHEGLHKTKIVLDKKNTILPKLWNDLTDAVKEVPSEVYPELGRMRYNLKIKTGEKMTMNQLDEGLKTISNAYGIPYKIKDKNKLLDIVNKMPAVIPFIGAGIGAYNMQNKAYGGEIQKPKKIQDLKKYLK
jgi:hypothetical protein